MSGGCHRGALRVSWGCLEGVMGVSGGCHGGVWRVLCKCLVSGGCQEDLIMSECDMFSIVCAIFKRRTTF